MHCVCANIFGAFVFNLRFKIDAVVIVIWSIVIIINSVLTLQVLTASLPHDREPCEIKVVSNHTCSLHTCICAGSRRVRVGLSGFRRQGISSTPGGFLKCPIPVQVCAEQRVYTIAGMVHTKHSSRWSQNEAACAYLRIVLVVYICEACLKFSSSSIEVKPRRKPKAYVSFAVIGNEAPPPSGQLTQAKPTGCRRLPLSSTRSEGR